MTGNARCDAEDRFPGTAVSDVALMSFPAPPVFTGRFLYGVATDSPGIQYVVRARIEFGKPGISQQS
jgi:hypothetical protein